jgi:hypothetical protein
MKLIIQDCAAYQDCALCAATSREWNSLLLAELAGVDEGAVTINISHVDGVVPVSY